MTWNRIEISLLIMTSSNENIFRVTGPCWENPPITGGFPSQRQVMQSFDVFFDLCLNNGWANNRDAGDLRRHCAHNDLTVMWDSLSPILPDLSFLDPLWSTYELNLWPRSSRELDISLRRNSVRSRYNTIYFSELSFVSNKCLPNGHMTQ